MTSKKKQKEIAPNKFWQGLGGSALKWLFAWLIAYVLGLVTPRSWLITELTQAPDVQAHYSLSQSGNCSVLSVQLGTSKESLDEVNIELEMPTSIVDHHVIVGGDDVGGVLRVTGLYTLDENACSIQTMETELDQTPNITSAVHGLSHSLFVLHAAPLVRSTPIVALFTMRNGALPKRLVGTYQYQRFEVPIKRGIIFTAIPANLFPVKPGVRHTVTITAHP